MKPFFVPNEILRVFKDYYPDVSLDQVDWGWEVPAKIYEAAFSNGEVDFEVEITVTGQLLLTEISMDVEDLPDHIIAAVQEEYPKHQIEEAEMVQYSNGDLSYELDLKNEETGEEFEAHFREDGYFIARGYDL